MILHDHILSADGYAARLMLALLGVAAEHRVVDIFAEGAEPWIEDDGQVVCGLAPILVHVARRSDPTRLPQGEGDPIAAVVGIRTMLDPADRLRNGRLFSAPHDEAADGKATMIAYRRLDDRLILAALAGRPFLGGDKPGVVDVAAFPLVALADDVGIPLDRFHGLAAWIDRMAVQPGFVAMPGVLVLPEPNG